MVAPLEVLWSESRILSLGFFKFWLITLIASSIKSTKILGSIISSD